jgi:hypothetical protein
MDGITKMKKYNVYLTDEQHAYLKLKAEQNGLKGSELLRRIIDEWKRKGGKV